MTIVTGVLAANGRLLKTAEEKLKRASEYRVQGVYANALPFTNVGFS
jgi:hypothetical protein